MIHQTKLIGLPNPKKKFKNRELKMSRSELKIFIDVFFKNTPYNVLSLCAGQVGGFIILLDSFIHSFISFHSFFHFQFD